MIPLFKVLMAEEAPERVAAVLRSGYIGQGPEVEAFEQEFAGALGLPEPPLSVNSGTSAIELALTLANVGVGGRVVVSPMTCAATVTPIVTRDAHPIWADVDPITGNVNAADAVRLARRWRAHAIIGVNWGGRPCDWETLRTAGVPVIEDAAHSFGGRTGGDYICWSLQAIKTLTTGDGGMLLAPSDQMERGRLLRWFGLDRRSRASFRCEQQITEAGWKYHMNDVAAAIGRANLGLAGEMAGVQAVNAVEMRERLAGCDHIMLPPWDDGMSWWLFTILCRDRPRVEAACREAGIETSQVHRRCDEHPAFAWAALNQLEARPGLQHFAAHQLSIPHGWWTTAADRERVAEVICGAA